MDKPVFNSVIEPAICVNDDETAVIELFNLEIDASCLASDELTTVDCSDCVRLRVVIDVSSVEMATVLPVVAVVNEELTLVRVVLIPATDVVSPPRLVLTFPKLELTFPKFVFVVANDVLSVFRFDVLALTDVESAMVELLTPLSVELRPDTEVLTLPRLA